MTNGVHGIKAALAHCPSEVWQRNPSTVYWFWPVTEHTLSGQVSILSLPELEYGVNALSFYLKKIDGLHLLSHSPMNVTDWFKLYTYKL